MDNAQLSGILKSLPESVSDITKLWIDRSPEQPAVVEGPTTWTYRQLDVLITDARAWLRASGVRPGDRVMIVCENCRAVIAIFLALTAIDAWPVFVNAKLSPREIDDIRDHCGARRVIYTTSVSPQAMQHAKRHGAVVEEVAGLGVIGLGPLNEKVEPEPLEEIRADRVAAVIYTSGTTGLPKGVVLTHKNLLFVAAISAKIRSLTPDDRVYSVLPMSHAVGLSVVVLGTLLSGATLYVVPRFDPVAALAALERDRLTVVLGVPSMFGLLVEYARIKGIVTLKFPALRIISSSGAPLQPVVKSAVEKLFGMPLYNGYGVTECSPNIAQAIVEKPRNDTSVGEVFPGIEVKLIDGSGERVAQGEVGELWVRGPNVMKGYYRAPDETAAAIDSEGWFNTRDLARLEDGNLFIVGRTKELIVRFGMNVYPAEVEAVLNSHPGVVRSAVIGRSLEGMEGGGEEVIAFVQLSPNSPPTIAELTSHTARNLAPYKHPSQIILVPEMPLTPTGKVKKDELAKLALSNSRTQ
jgi:long-chain acyl-CoA synthetase